MDSPPAIDETKTANTEIILEKENNNAPVTVEINRTEAISATVKSENTHEEQQQPSMQTSIQNEIFQITENIGVNLDSEKTITTEIPKNNPSPPAAAPSSTNATFDIFEPTPKPGNLPTDSNQSNNDDVWGPTGTIKTTNTPFLDNNNNEVSGLKVDDSHTRQVSSTSNGSSSTSGAQMSGSSNIQNVFNSVSNNNNNNSEFDKNNNSDTTINNNNNNNSSGFAGFGFDSVKHDDFHPQNTGNNHNNNSSSSFNPSKDPWTMPKGETKQEQQQQQQQNSFQNTGTSNSGWGNISNERSSSQFNNNNGLRQPYPSNGSGSSSGSNGYGSGANNFNNNYGGKSDTYFGKSSNDISFGRQDSYGKPMGGGRSSMSNDIYDRMDRNDGYGQRENSNSFGRNDNFMKKEVNYGRGGYDNYGENAYSKYDNSKFDHYKSDSFKDMPYPRDNNNNNRNNNNYGNDFGRYDHKYDNGHKNNNNFDGGYSNMGGRGDIFPPSSNYDDSFPDEYSNYRDTTPQYDSRRTLYVGQLHPIINEQQLKDCFMLFGEVVSCKMHKEPQHKSYCFIEFRTKECATAAKIGMNMRKLHDIPIEVNWANTNSTLYNKKKLPQDKFGVFIGDIPPEMTNDELFQLFDKSFNHVVDARIVVEPLSQKSKQYGFVNFTVKQSAERAIKEWNNNKEIEGRPIRLGWADRSQRNIPTKTYDEICRLPNFTGTNTTVYIGGVKEGVSEDKLKQIFSEFGDMKEVRLFTEKGYAFISFIRHQSAQEAIRHKTGTQIEGHTIRCAWGRENNGPPDGSDPLGEMNDITKCFDDMDAHEAKNKNSALGSFAGDMSDSLGAFRSDYNNNSLTGEFGQNSFSNNNNNRSSPNGTDSWMKMTESTKSDMVFNANIWNTESVQN